MSTSYVMNPAWVTKVVASSWEVLEDTIPPAWRPRLDSVTPGYGGRISARVKEYGCGVFGCVFPTHDPKIVMKVTSDETEAEFAARLSTTLAAPIVVRYVKVIGLSTRHEGNRIHLMWREAADKVGKVFEVLGPIAATYVDNQHAAAQKAFLALSGEEVLADDDRPAGPEELLSLWLDTCIAMAEWPPLSELGNGLVKIYRTQRIFFGDVHTGNLGIVHRNDGDHWVITDPGYASVISES